MLPVGGGLAKNESIVRTDVFRKPNKKGKWEFHLVPVYVADVMAGVTPDKAIASGKWPVMDESFEFMFSLYPYDLVRLTTDKEVVLGYYRVVDRATGQMSLSSPNNNAAPLQRPGVRTALSVEKYEVGLLGDYYPVRKEKRRVLENGGGIESGETED